LDYENFETIYVKEAKELKDYKIRLMTERNTIMREIQFDKFVKPRTALDEAYESIEVYEAELTEEQKKWTNINWKRDLIKNWKGIKDHTWNRLRSFEIHGKQIYKDYDKTQPKKEDKEENANERDHILGQDENEKDGHKHSIDKDEWDEDKTPEECRLKQALYQSILDDPPTEEEVNKFVQEIATNEKELSNSIDNLINLAQKDKNFMMERLIKMEIKKNRKNLRKSQEKLDNVRITLEQKREQYWKAKGVVTECFAAHIEYRWKKKQLIEKDYEKTRRVLLNFLTAKWMTKDDLIEKLN